MPLIYIIHIYDFCNKMLFLKIKDNCIILKENMKIIKNNFSALYVADITSQERKILQILYICMVKTQ